MQVNFGLLFPFQGLLLTFDKHFFLHRIEREVKCSRTSLQTWRITLPLVRFRNHTGVVLGDLSGICVPPVLFLTLLEIFLRGMINFPKTLTPPLPAMPSLCAMSHSM